MTNKPLFLLLLFFIGVGTSFIPAYAQSTATKTPTGFYSLDAIKRATEAAPKAPAEITEDISESIETKPAPPVAPPASSLPAAEPKPAAIAAPSPPAATEIKKPAPPVKAKAKKVQKPKTATVKAKSKTLQKPKTVPVPQKSEQFIVNPDGTITINAQPQSSPEPVNEEPRIQDPASYLAPIIQEKKTQPLNNNKPARTAKSRPVKKRTPLASDAPYKPSDDWFKKATEQNNGYRPVLRDLKAPPSAPMALPEAQDNTVQPAPIPAETFEKESIQWKKPALEKEKSLNNTEAKPEIPPPQKPPVSPIDTKSEQTPAPPEEKEATSRLDRARDWLNQIKKPLQVEKPDNTTINKK